MKMMIKEYSLTYKRKNVDMDRMLDSKKVNLIARPIFNDFMNIYECFYVFMLDNQNNVKGFAKIAQGGVAACQADIRLIAKYAIESLAAAIIIVHNHPTGALEPSLEDKAITRNITLALDLFNIKVLDHIILTEDGYFSFRDENLM